MKITPIFNTVTMNWLGFVLVLNLVACSTGLTYLDKCYCPKKDPYLNRDQNLRRKMYELRREWTKTWDVYNKRGKNCKIVSQFGLTFVDGFSFLS